MAIRIIILSLSFVSLVGCAGSGGAAGPGKSGTSSSDARYLGPKAPVPTDRVSYRVDSETVTIAGFVSKRPWRKSSLSYCAQGGMFVAVSNKRRSTILVFRDKILWKRAVDRKTRQKLTGFYLRKYIPHPKRGQHPSTGTPYFECRVFEVRALAD